MRKILLIAAISFISTSVALSQKDVLLEIDDEKVTLEEFKRIYFKNNKDSALNLQSLEEYLDLFTKFKLKVHEARKIGLHENDKFKKELATYRDQLTKPYLTDSSTDERLIREAYERMRYIVRAEHILLKIPPKAKPEDTVETYNKAKEIIAKLRKGADFAKLAKQHSQDPSVRYNDGDLGYFSAFKMVYPFENAAFNLKIGEVSDPVRTRFGYHIIKLTDRKDAPGEVQAAHIMIRLPQNASKEATEKAKKKIQEAYDDLEGGADFAELAEEYSDDKQTAQKDGMLPKFSPGRMLPSFEEEIFKLEKGYYSKPFRTKVGFHIVKLIDNNPVAPLEKERATIKRKLSKTARASLSRQKVLQRLKKEYNFNCNDEKLGKFYNSVNADSLMNGKWVMDKEIENETVCSFADQEITTNELIKILKQNVHQPKTTANQYLKKVTDRYIEKRIIEYEKEHLDEKYPDFAWLMKEYHDGILLFNITDSVVWKKAVKDTTGLKAYFENNRENYMWEKRMQMDVIDVKPLHKSGKTKRLIAKAYKKGNEENLQKLLREKYSDTTITVKTDSGKYEKGTNRYLSKTNWETGLHLVEQNDNQGTFVYNHKVIPATTKKLENVRGIVTADYQNFLEEKWIESLKEKYDIEVHEELLKKLLK